MFLYCRHYSLPLWKEISVFNKSTLKLHFHKKICKNETKYCILEYYCILRIIVLNTKITGD